MTGQDPLAQRDVLAYAKALAWEQHRSGRGGWRDRLPAPVRLRVKLLATKAARRASIRTFRRLAEAGDLRLDLGSGFVREEAWIGVDLAGNGADVAWDITTPLPLPDGCAVGVRLVHVIEHFDIATTHRILTEARRLLAPTASLEIAVPDLARYASDYVAPDGFLDACRAGRPTRGLAMQEVFFLYGHRVMYDFETLDVVVRSAGFTSVVQADPQQRSAMLGDEPTREIESLAVVCRR